MPSHDIEAEIDRLYQLPLERFTAARNELAGRLRGPDAGKVKALAKPALSAWAVNQLYWSSREAFDRIIDTVARLRESHERASEGRSQQLRAATAAHREAIKEALDQIEVILEKASHPLTSTLRQAVTRTLEALPRDQAGRLAQPITPAGFEMLEGLDLPRSRVSRASRDESPDPRTSMTSPESPGGRQHRSPHPSQAASLSTHVESKTKGRLAAKRETQQRVSAHRQAERELKEAVRSLAQARRRSRAAERKSRASRKLLDEERKNEKRALEDLQKARSRLGPIEEGARRSAEEADKAASEVRVSEKGAQEASERLSVLRSSMGPAKK